MRIEQWLGENNTLGIDIWQKKYQYENESFDEWLERVSGGNEEVKKLIKDKKFLFGGRILANRGLNKLGKKVTYSNCYVLSTGDSIEEIYKTCSDMARTFSYGGGVGVSLNPLRPRGSVVNNSAKYTTGTVSFMDTFSQVAETIGQNGRRGATMLSLSCEHPDLEEFIDIKNDLTKVTKANISVEITDKFMQAVINKEMFKTKFVVGTGEIIEKEVDAYKLFHKLAYNNWNMGEPGMLFWDTIENYNLMSKDKNFKYAGVNPCAEEPLPNGGSCLLGSINLDAYVEYEEFQFERFENDIAIIVKAMNDVLDEGLPLHPLEIQRQTVHDLRQIGIGIMGLADALIHMNLRYDSKEALEVCDDIAYTLANSALKASALLAKEYGAFPKCDKVKILASDFMMNNADEDTLDLIEEYGLRNSQILTCAPTGSISTMLGISGGIEPIFNTSYTRKTESLHGGTKYYKVYTPIVKEIMLASDITEDDLIFATAQNINPFMRVKMQSVWQQHIDASISSTINLPNEATVELVEQLYIEAWKQNLKGLTIFRDGCARLAVLSNSNEQTEENDELHRGQWKSLAEDTYYVKRSLSIGCGKLKLFIGYSPSEQAVQDLYIVKTGQGGCTNNLQALAISMSALLRVGGNLEQLEKAFSGITPCPSFVSARAKGVELSKGNYCGMAIINEVKAFLAGQKVEKIEKSKETEYNTCPECGEKTLINTGGCNTCNSCGWSRCV